jgi:MerR family mercuric resistance operon transcriptional regulator
MTAALRTSQLADAAGVNVQTLRYYERRGLLAEPRRTLGGHRLYPPETVLALRSIKAAQRLGCTLDDIATLLALGRGSRRRAGGLHARAIEKLTEVEARIADLTDIRDTLRAAVEAGCDDPDTCAATDACPLPFPPTGAAADPDDLA